MESFEMKLHLQPEHAGVMQRLHRTILSKDALWLRRNPDKSELLLYAHPGKSFSRAEAFF
jgi:hypothetical protein